MKRVALYARVSSEEQVRHGYSIGAQITALRDYAKKKNYVVVGEYVDEGISARKSYKKRPALLSLLEAVQDDKIDIVLFIKLDRWFRNVEAYYQVQPILDKHNVAWQAITEEYETVTASGRLKVNIMLSVAQDEADRTSERIKFIFADKKSRGEVITGKIPFGYKTVDKHMEIDEHDGQIAREIFQKYIDYRSILETCRWLYSSYGITRNVSGMRRLLANKLYLGGEHHPQLIDRETFAKTQEILSSRSHRRCRETSKVYLFGGMVYCKDCGMRMKAYQPKAYEYYACRMHQDYGKCINSISTRQDRLESYLLDNIVGALQEYNITVMENAKPVKDPDKIKKKMEKLKDLYLNDLISREIYERDYRALESDLNDAAYAPKIISVDTIDDAVKKYRSLSKVSQKSFWSRILKRIEIDHNGDIFLIFG